MTKKIVTLLDTDKAVHEAVDKLGKQPESTFDWRFVQFSRETSRLVPIYGAVGDLNGSAVASPVVGGAMVRSGVGQGDAPIIGIREELGIGEEEAQYYAQGLEHGGEILVIETPDERVDAACQCLEELGGQGVMIIDG